MTAPYVEAMPDGLFGAGCDCDELMWTGDGLVLRDVVDVTVDPEVL